MVSRIAILLAALMIVGGVTHAATYTKVADADGTIGVSFGTPYGWINTWGDSDIRVGYGDYQTRRAIMKFNIDWNQVQATITAATLKIDTMTIPSSEYDDLKLALVTEDFTGTDGNTDYNNRKSGVAWTTAGGSPDTSTEIDVTDLASSTSYNIDVKSLIQTWQGNKTGNFGLIFYDATKDSTGSNNYSRIYATESADPPDEGAHQDPTLVIESIPEPASLALLAIGGIGVLLRRRR